MEKHLRTEELTLLLEGQLNALDLERVKEHMSQCDRCRQVYRDAAMDRGLWSTDKDQFPTSDDLIQAGNAVASRGMPEAVEVPVWAGRPRRSRMPRFAVAAAVVVVAASLLFLRDGRMGQPPALDVAIVDPIREAAETMSASGGMIIPGGEGFEIATAEPLRSGNAPGGIDAPLEQLRAAVAEEDASLDEYCWLIAGLLASGDRSEARTHMMGLPNAYRDEPRVKALMAAVYFADDNLEVAGDYLQQLAGDNPDDPVVEFNLAVVLAAGGNTVEAAGHFESVAQSHPGTPIAARAEQSLAELRAP